MGNEHTLLLFIYVPVTSLMKPAYMYTLNQCMTSTMYWLKSINKYLALRNLLNYLRGTS